MADTFTTVERVIAGWGCIDRLGEIAAGLGRRALLVTGRKSLRAAGITDRLIDIAVSAGVAVEVFEQVEPEPSVATVDAACEAVLAGRCEVVIAAGGGSAIDVGKAAAALAAGEAPTGDYFADRPLPARALPIIAVPTTAGTGSEATPNSVLTDPDRGIKQSIRGPSLLPRAAIVDAGLTVSCSPVVTAAAGMDALTQAIEAYLSRHATDITDALSLHAVRLIAGAIVAAWRDGADRPAREAMAHGALLAGMAFANARLGAVHGMAHPIGFRYRLPHGAVCAALLPHVLRFNAPAAGAKYARLHEILGDNPAEATVRLLEEMGLPQRFGAAGLREEDFDAIAAESLPSGSMKANPRPVSAEDIRGILAELL